MIEKYFIEKYFIETYFIETYFYRPGTPPKSWDFKFPIESCRNYVLRRLRTRVTKVLKFPQHIPKNITHYRGTGPLQKLGF